MKMKKVKKKAVKTAKDWYNDGLTAMVRGFFKDATSYLTKSIKLNPDSWASYANRGSAYHNLSEYNKALTDYNRAIEIQPRHSQIYYFRGVNFMKLEQYEEALDDFNKASELFPSSLRIRHHRGLASLALNSKEKVESFTEEEILKSEKDSLIEKMSLPQFSEIANFLNKQ